MKCNSMGRHQGRLQQSTPHHSSGSLGRPGRNVMNREFLLHSSSDIEDQLADASGGSGVTQITVPARLDSEINPYFDKKTSCQSASSTHPPSSEITSHLIEHLLKLRAASSSSSSSAPEAEPSGSDPSTGGVRAH